MLTWYVTLREERRLTVFEDTVLRSIYWPEEEDVTGDWTKVHDVAIHNLYLSPNNILVVKTRLVIYAGHVEHVQERRGVCRVLVLTSWVKVTCET